jgi:limonene-1,2-epoxide hydrolase
MTPEEFVELFIAGWTMPKPDGFIAHFGALSHPDVVATQPLLPTATGPDAYMRSFRNTFALMPDMRTEVLSSACADDTVFIESHATANIGGRRISFDVADRFVLRDGLIYRRQAYFDPTPIIIGVLLRPWVLPAVLRCLRG